MNLEKMFAAQKALREHINYNEPDRFEKLILALLVEIGECANCWRGFKFWSKDQEPRTEKRIHCKKCEGTGNLYWDVNYTDEEKKYLECDMCNGFRKVRVNPLLEEYVDGLHFVLELGIEKGWDKGIETPALLKDEDITSQFIHTKKMVIDFWATGDYTYYKFLVGGYLGLGEMLGFTWDEIEQGYYDKNQINHERQENGY